MMAVTFARRAEGKRAAIEPARARPSAPVGRPGTPLFLQRKALAIDPEESPLEREADAVAERIMRMPEPQVQRACPCGGGCPKCRAEQPGQEHEFLQTKRVQSRDAGQITADFPEKKEGILQSKKDPSHSPEATSALEDQLNNVRNDGQPLSQSLRDFFEPRFGYSFSQVMVHTGAQAARLARAVNALAYTVGDDIVFEAGRFSPQSSEGRRLLAHELTHVIQQKQGEHQLQRFARCEVARLSLEECPPRLRGEAQHARGGPMVFLSLPPVSGERGALIANFDIGSAAIKPNLHKTLNWKTFLRDITSDRSQWKLVGFTDCQGEESLNKELREQRATAVFDILPKELQLQITSHEGASINDCITENSSAADRVLNRSVALLFEHSFADFTPEEVTASTKFVCGPDVTQQVADVVQLTKGIFTTQNSSQRKDSCDYLISLGKYANAWDIIQLHKNAWIHEKFRPLCATEGAKPSCGETVQIDDDCHHAGAVNYVIYGTMFRLCSDENPDLFFSFSKSNMKALIDMYKGSGVTGLATPVPNFQGSLAWANAGYDGWPSGVSSPSGDRNNCVPICPRKYVGPAFEINWNPHHHKSGWGWKPAT